MNETSCFAPYVDSFLFDRKVTDCEKAKHYIGTDGKQILENLRYLCSEGKEIILRCPIIPGVNNEEGHFSKILSGSGISIDPVCQAAALL